MSCFRLLGVFSLLLFCTLASVQAQSPDISQVQTSDISGQRPTDARNDIDSEMQRRARVLRQKKRAEDMKRDSQKLLELATQLKLYVDKAGDSVLSVEVVKKAEEMEKLARQVKKNMQGE